MKRYLICSIYIILFQFHTLLSSDNKAEYVDDEIIVKFHHDYLENEYLTSKGEFLILRNSIKYNRMKKEYQSKFNNLLGDGDSIQKLARKFQLKDSISISRSGKQVNVKDIIDICLIKFAKSKNNIREICDSLSKLDFIIYAEPNYLIKQSSFTPNDEYYYLQKGLEQTNNIDIDIERAWNFTTGNYGVRVGVIDNGVDYDNPDLGDGLFGVDGAKVRGGWDYFNNDADPKYDHYLEYSHGTQVAGIIGAYRNNEIGIAGIAGGEEGLNLGCQIFALKAGPAMCADYSYRCLKSSNIIQAIIDAATGYGCHIINASFGGGNYTESERDAIRIAAQNNVLVVVSKGNSNTDNFNYPADYDNNWVLSVGASDENDAKASFSNFGNKIDVVAPGVDNMIYTTFGPEYYTSFNGTSASAPVVSGVASLILSEAIEQNRTLHFNDVEGLICSSAEDVNFSTYPGYDDYLGYGRVNAGKALEMMNKPWQMNYHSVIGGVLYDSTDWINVYLINPGGNMTTGIYSAKRIEVRKTITLPNYLNDTYIWTRTVNESVGWSQANPNYQLGYSEVFSRNGNQVTLRTFIYRLYNSLGQYIGYKPTTYDNVVFEYTTLGIPCYENVHLVETFSEDLDDNTTTISASNNITASNIIESNADVHYKAGSSIRLWPGVHIKEGSEFRANIDKCEETTYSKINLSINEKFIEHKKSSMLKLSPNPTSGNALATVEIGERSICSLVLLDNLGNEVIAIFKDKELSPGTYQYDLESDNLSSGVYLCVLRIGNSLHSEKLVYLK